MKKGKYISANRRQRGFTMMELVITITLVSITAALAVPSMRTYVLNSRMTGASQEVLRSLQTARSEATKRQRNVVVCASANPTAGTAAACTTSVPSGWIMFEDTDNGVDHDTTEELIDIHTVDSSKVSLVGDGAVSYAASGFANPGGATAIVICDSRGNVDSNGLGVGDSGVQAQSVARGIDIAGTGRARITRDLVEIDGLLTDIGSSCP